MKEIFCHLHTVILWYLKYFLPWKGNKLGITDMPLQGLNFIMTIMAMASDKEKNGHG